MKLVVSGGCRGGERGERREERLLRGKVLRLSTGGWRSSVTLVLAATDCMEWSGGDCGLIYFLFCTIIKQRTSQAWPVVGVRVLQTFCLHIS